MVAERVAKRVVEAWRRRRVLQQAPFRMEILGEGALDFRAQLFELRNEHTEPRMRVRFQVGAGPEGCGADLCFAIGKFHDTRVFLRHILVWREQDYVAARSPQDFPE